MGALVNMHPLREYIRKLLTEDPMGFVHDLAASSKEHGEWSWGNISKDAGRDIKRAFNKHADHRWLSSLDTVHWTDGYGLKGLTSGKDELSTTMSLPGGKLDPVTFIMEVGLWIKGRITLAVNDQDRLYSGKWDDYMGAGLRSKKGKAQRHRQKSSGVNKLPTISKDYSRYDQLEPGTEFAEKMARNIPYVLDQSTWDPSPSHPNEALVDNWKPVGIVVVDDRDGSRIEAVKAHAQDPLKAVGMIKQIFQAAEMFGVPIYDVNRNELWAPGKKEVKETAVREYIRGLLVEIAIGQCYPHVIKMAQDATNEEFNDLTRFKVVHGRITDKFSGESVLHAWVEKGNMVFDWQTHSTKPGGIDRETYYDIFQPEIHDEYTAEETMVNCLKSGGKAGPWINEGFLVEQEEEQSEFDKLQDIFVSNGAQAVELGEMLLPDSPEIRAMREIVDSTRSFLKLFENPELVYKVRQEQRDPWNFKVKDLLEIAVSDKIKRRRLITMMFELGQAYINLEGIIGFGRLHQWVPKIEAAAEWAGIPVPKIPEMWPS